MITAVRNVVDRFLGRGSAAIAVPVMDGASKPNRLLDEAEILVNLPGLDDIACDDHQVLLSAGPCLYRLEGDKAVEVKRFDQLITALALGRNGTLALALGGKQVLCFSSDGSGGWSETHKLEVLDGRPIRCVNALAFDAHDHVILSEGSSTLDPSEWSRDLMELGHSGRVSRWNPVNATTHVLAHQKRYAFGVLPLGNNILFSESWNHRVIAFSNGRTDDFSDELSGYPSRMAPASDGGYWLSCFVCRSQLVEFVLREPAYRKRMLAEVDPAYWIAPALSSGKSYLEPLQGAGVKQMGVLKPWAPPRSYGLVLRFDSNGKLLGSLHSQVDGKHHGITAVAEYGGALLAVSKGSGRLLRVDLSKMEHLA